MPKPETIEDLLEFDYLDRAEIRRRGDDPIVLWQGAGMVWREINDEHQVLMVRRYHSPNLWHFPETTTFEQKDVDIKGAAVEAVEQIFKTKIEATDHFGPFTIRIKTRRFGPKLFIKKSLHVWLMSAEDCFADLDSGVIWLEAKWFPVRSLPSLMPNRSRHIKSIIERRFNVTEEQPPPEEDVAIQVTDKLKMVSQFYAPGTDVQWRDIKRQLVKLMPSYIKKIFSKAHFSTGEQVPNRFERDLMKHWETLTGRAPLLTEGIHDEKAYQARLEFRRARTAAGIYSFDKKHYFDTDNWTSRSEVFRARREAKKLDGG